MAGKTTKNTAVDTTQKGAGEGATEFNAKELLEKIATLEASVTLLTTQKTELENAVQLGISDLETLREQLKQAKQIPNGYVLLPVVPDEEIMMAESDDQTTPWDGVSECRKIRRRVLAAVCNVLLARQEAAE